MSNNLSDFMKYGMRDLPKLFNVPYPTYEIELPQTRQRFIVRALKLAEEEKLYNVRASWEKVFFNLVKIAYEAVEQPRFESFEQFTKSITMADFETVLFGIFVASYGEVNPELQCASCSRVNKKSFDILNCARFNMYDNTDVQFFDKIMTVVLPYTKLNVTLKPINLHDVLTVFKETADKPQLQSAFLKVLNIDQIANEDKTFVVDSKLEIASALDRVPVRDVRYLSKIIHDEYDQYKMTLEAEFTCDFCGAENRAPLSILTELFRSATRQDIL